MNGSLYGVGLGPGDPELITLKAARLIRSAKVIAYPTLAGADSFARSIAAQNAELLTLLKLEIDVLQNQFFAKSRRVFLVEVLNPDHPGTTRRDTKRRNKRAKTLKTRLKTTR